MSWQPPLAAPMPIVAYVVTPWIGQVAQTPTRFNSTATTETVVGLTNGTTYRFTVVAINSLGNDSASSASSNAVTPGFSFVKGVSSNHRYLLDQTGHPYMVVGDAPQALAANVSEADMDKYFADRQAHGINATWINLLCATYTGLQ